MKEILIGYVDTSSGALLVTDPTIASEFNTDDNTEWDSLVLLDELTKTRYVENQDFYSLDDINAIYNETFGALLAEGRLIIEPPTERKDYSYMGAISQSRRGGGTLTYEDSSEGAGVAVPTFCGEGSYPVYALIDDSGRTIQIRIILMENQDCSRATCELCPVREDRVRGEEVPVDNGRCGSHTSGCGSDCDTEDCS
jgi:hypothetical protein